MILKFVVLGGFKYLLFIFFVNLWIFVSKDLW